MSSRDLVSVLGYTPVPRVKRAAKLLLSLLVTALFTWWAFKDTDWAGQWRSLASASYIWVLPYFGVLTAIHVCRTLRWGYLLSGIERVRFRALNEAAGIGFMMLLILPFRLGEFARPFLIAQRSTIRRSPAMTTVVLERIVDGLIIATMLRTLLFFIPRTGPEVDRVRLGANIMFLIFGGGLVFLLFSLWQRERAVRLVRATVGAVLPAVADKVAGVVDAFVGAMKQLPGPGAIFGFFFFTACYWGLNGLGMTLLANAFGFSLTIFQGYVVLSVLVVGLMIPAAPGMMGTFQWGIKIGLLLFLPPAVVNAKGLAYANVMWLCQTVQQVGFGLILLSLGHLSFKDIAGKLEKEPEAAA